MSRDIVVQLKGAKLTRGPVPVFTGVDLVLNRGTVAALVGANGAGKSTLMNTLAGLLDLDKGERMAATGMRSAYAPQEPDLGGATDLVGWAATDIPHDRDETTRRAQAAASLQSFGLSPDRSTQGMSGGELKRAGLARAFAADADLLMLDEPTNHLDVLAIQDLEARLKGFNGAALVVSHDRRFLEKIANVCFWLRQGKVARLDGGYAKFDAWSEAIEEDDIRQLEKLDKTLIKEAHWVSRGVTGRRKRNMGRMRKLDTLRDERRQRASLIKRDMESVADSGAASGKIVLDLKGVSKAWEGRGPIVSNLDLRIVRGDRLGIVGPNGAGKTTLISILTGDLEPDSGTVKRGTNLTMAYLDQTRATLDGSATLWDTLTPGGGDQVMVRGKPKHVAAYARDFLFGPDQLRQPVASLSGGERNRLLLSLALANPANLLILDEPTNDLDAETLDLLEQTLADYDGTVIVVSHDRAFLDGVVTATLAPLGDGRWVETPGGWSDLERQGLPTLRRAAPAKSTAPPPPPPVTAKARLTFKDEHRLAALEKLIPKLEAEIAAHEAELADASLYTRDPKAFDAAMAGVVKARAELVASEEEWLTLEERKAGG